ncbi:MAG: hypothetical protein A4E53_01838 [Pelotomaculum sp. PtaB.Bin104]|nr:MAG: hypothetical protein A4E53_01838 [Pelotomaculum sp. PtaB.Bin104]
MERRWVIFPFIDYSIYNDELSADRFKENESGQTLTLGKSELAFNMPLSYVLRETIGLG